MKRITQMQIAHSLCGHVEFMPAMTRDANGIHMAVMLSITSSNSQKNQIADLKLWTAVQCHSARDTEQELCQELTSFSVFALPFPDS